MFIEINIEVWKIFSFIICYSVGSLCNIEISVVVILQFCNYCIGVVYFVFVGNDFDIKDVNWLVSNKIKIVSVFVGSEKRRCFFYR